MCSGAGIGGSVQLADHGAAQRNSCSNPNPGILGAALFVLIGTPACVRKRKSWQPRISCPLRMLLATDGRWSWVTYFDPK